MIETYRGTVYPWQCDHMGHMNVQFYNAKFDEATWQLFSNISITPEYIRTERKGMAALEQKTIYLKEVLPGDTISIFSEILEVQSKKIRFRHQMKKNTDEVVAQTELLGMHIDRNTRKGCDFSRAVYKKALSLIKREDTEPSPQQSLS